MKFVPVLEIVLPQHQTSSLSFIKLHVFQCDHFSYLFNYEKFFLMYSDESKIWKVRMFENSTGKLLCDHLVMALKIHSRNVLIMHLLQGSSTLSERGINVLIKGLKLGAVRMDDSA